ncbi:AroM family protein [Gelria sp. Kuro-4]|uniref:AroM family protein n=1 Tax=Gelria sp. Kuro-4 TaxID=2796927 RepID=UPI001BEF30ED|nr:AroM family protein [Gelria sp. Kuro-4]BCV23648.1 hypothetical protein kuro4_04210 [Gelria sp. Kuro-4]
MKKVLGTVTIGQAPREDLVPELAAILGRDTEIKEAGALDGLTKEEIARLAPEPGDYVLVTRLQDGSAVKVAEKHIYPRLQAKTAELFRQGIPVVALLCTGEFPRFAGAGLLVRPQPVLYNVTAALAADLRLGVLIPAPDQIAQAATRWRAVGRAQIVRAASPYGDPRELEEAAGDLAAAGVELTVMDCMGYTLAMQEKVRRLTGAPVVLARGIVARVLREILG